MFNHLRSMFNYPWQYVQLQWEVCSTTLGTMFNSPGEYVPLPWGVFSTTLGNMFNYPAWKWFEKVRKIVQHVPGDVIFQKSDPPEAAPLLAPCLKIENAVQIVGSQSRKLPSRQGFRQYFQYFDFSFYEPGLKSKTFYIVRRCASVWRGPGFFWSCICGERANLKLGFCRSVFIK